MLPHAKNPFSHCLFPTATRWLASLLLFLAWATNAETVVTHPFAGVTHYHRTETSPRPLDMHIIEIKLATPGIGFAVTPSNGDKPGYTTRQRTTDFVTQTGAQIAINGTYYKTAGSGIGETGLTEYYADLMYFSYSAGTPVSPWSGTGDPKERGINLAPNNQATFIKPDAINKTNFVTRPAGTVLHNAIGSFDGILIGNTNVADDVNLHPRTAMGINANKTKLFLFTVDGRQPGYSEGMTTPEMAQLLRDDYGVTDAINLDGGGSTVMVFADPAVRIVNRPSEAERLHGCNFAVFAAVPQPAFVQPESVHASADGTFQFTFSGTPGGYYAVEVSTNLSHWDLAQFVSMSTTNSVFTDTNQAPAQRFYRVRIAD